MTVEQKRQLGPDGVYVSKEGFAKALADAVEARNGAPKESEEPFKRRKLPEVVEVGTAERLGRMHEAAAKVAAQASLKAQLISELVQTFLNDDSLQRLEYDTQKADAARALSISQMDVHRAVMNEIDKARKDKPPKEVELSQAQKAVALALNHRFWTNTSDGTPHASVQVGLHWEHYRIGSSDFEAWVRAEYCARHFQKINDQKVPMPISDHALHEGIATMKALALTSGNSATSALRIARREGEVWLDLVSRDWELVKVTAKGWKLFPAGSPDVALVRMKGMYELPEPKQGGDIRELRELLNVSASDFVLQVGWLLGAFQDGPYPINIITGVPGAAKTSTCRVLHRSIDPNFADLTPLTSTDDIHVAAFNRFVLGFDNISHITAEQADVLCRLSTGTGYAKRMLRTDADQFMMQACRPILLNGIPDDLADRSDLADRAIVSELPMLDEETQLGDQEFWALFNESRPRILGALLDGVAGALRGARDIHLDGYGRIRMIDFARWAEAGCRALGFEEGEFLTAFVANQERALRILFKQDLVAQAVALLMERQARWAGNTKELLPALCKAVKEAKRSAMLSEKGWPPNDVWLGRKLRRSAIVLRKVAEIEINFDVNLRQTGEGDKDGLEIILRKVGE
jgi:hypothetical protein